MKIGFDIDYADLKAFHTYYLKTDKTIRKTKRLLVWVFVLLFLVIGLLTPDDPFHGTGLFSLIGVIIVCALWIFFSGKLFNFSFFQQVKKIYKNPGNSIYFGHREMTFDEDHIRIKTDKIDEKLSWDTIIKVAETGDYLFLFISTNQAYVIPKAKIGQQHVEALRTLLNENRLQS